MAQRKRELEDALTHAFDELMTRARAVERRFRVDPAPDPAVAALGDLVRRIDHLLDEDVDTAPDVDPGSAV